ncbi:uncharacterized protein LOC103518033 isoform X2 [Diaphorina citri]|uniref:Uncharacterized protein LOC103518033 isoform X1 n=1 Tax=Diaphorina citri TaxID=121845 RepID=A0A1S3DGA9_DIACI|nr:uncharacterized protein LOC103518033 isoform X1 [Diaphorina citri]XP_026685744.1 uncharacterized protein LOC103518033 isoform X2 [Diaphorina citri]KAI5694677.1 hypothetical protein M8J75_003166 [Diaphorina citri]KAI5716763.1 hypothetical protein M8J76_011961 [Diaphorina citri]KAI5718301.1 hypothetical protein M8J77_019197 [Diaphorina citri]
MAILPIPACLESFPTGKSLKTGMIITCILVLLIFILCAIVHTLLCGHDFGRYVGMYNIGTNVVIIIFFIVVLILVFLDEKIPGIVHFICIVIWVVLAVLAVASLVSDILDILSGHYYGPCKTSAFVELVLSIVGVVVLVFGVFVYWSFYVEMD